jgi:hypothetical protein
MRTLKERTAHEEKFIFHYTAYLQTLPTASQKMIIRTALE